LISSIATSAPRRIASPDSASAVAKSAFNPTTTGSAAIAHALHNAATPNQPATLFICSPIGQRMPDLSDPNHYLQPPRLNNYLTSYVFASSDFLIPQENELARFGEKWEMYFDRITGFTG
jgi:hypothetical protein